MTLLHLLVSCTQLIVDKKMITRKYLFKWFPIDLIGSIPWEIIFRIITAVSGENDASDVQVVSLLRLLKAPKLLRIGRLVKVLESWDGAANVGRIVALMIIMTVFVHWISCIWCAMLANLSACPCAMLGTAFTCGRGCPARAQVFGRF